MYHGGSRQTCIRRSIRNVLARKKQWNVENSLPAGRNESTESPDEHLEIPLNFYLHSPRSKVFRSQTHNRAARKFTDLRYLGLVHLSKQLVDMDIQLQK